jgi:geranylgeranyl pyrophosphate synthase
VIDEYTRNRIGTALRFRNSVAVSESSAQLLDDARRDRGIATATRSAMAIVQAPHRRSVTSVAMLEEVEARLRDELHVRDHVTFGPVRAIALAKSKRVRAGLTLACARTVGAPARATVELAVAIELVHAFSLVHDDIEDGAEMRRGHPAVHVVEGIPVAINAGDALHALAWSALLAIDAPAARTLEVARLFGITADRMVAGQARDLVWTRDHRSDLAIDDYLAMVRGKTGALLGFAAAAPAGIVGHAAVDALYTFGEQLGVALQILDDVASLRCDSQSLGKPVGASANGVGSAPALLAGPADDGTSAAIELAHQHWTRAIEHLRSTELADDNELETHARTMLARLLVACGGTA